jgi:hypothetical protein
MRLHFRPIHSAIVVLGALAAFVSMVAASAAAPPPGPGLGSGTSADPPVVSGLQVTPRVLHGGSPHATIDYALSETADVVFDLARGTKACGTCAPRWTIVMTFGATGANGPNRVALPAQAARDARLAPGAYRLIATPIDGTDTQGAPATARLRIAGRRQPSRPA